MIKLKNLIFETSVYAIPSGHGTKNTTFTSPSIGRRHHRNEKGGGFEGSPPSDEYTLTADDEEKLKTLSLSQRRLFMTKKLRDARKARGVCALCAGTPEKKANGMLKTLCPNCWERYKKFQTKRVSQGMCRGCLASPVAVAPDGTKMTFCQSCLDKRKINNRDFYHKRIKQGMCPRCGKNPLHVDSSGNEYSKCFDCLKDNLKYKTHTDEGTSEGMDQYFPNGQFDWTLFFNSNKEGHNLDPDAAADLISSEYGKQLTPPEVFHIILTCPSAEIKDVYQFALKHLTPEQLSHVKIQVDTFHK
jgi:hypothetical protein